MWLEAVLGPARVVCSDRHGGVSQPPYGTCNVGDHVGDEPAAVHENRRRVARAAGLPTPARWVWLRQVHGANVHVAAGAAAPPVADAAVTATLGLPLAVVAADCAPLVLACDDAVAVAHVGHRGLRAGVVARAVGALRAQGNGPVRAFLGPCIRPARYEFGADDLAGLVERFGPSVAARTEQRGLALDLPEAVRVALAETGVVDLDDCGTCTAGSPDHFSYRRDGTTGRQVTVAVLR